MGREISGTSGGRVGGSTWCNILNNSRHFLFFIFSVTEYTGRSLQYLLK